MLWLIPVVLGALFLPGCDDEEESLRGQNLHPDGDNWMAKKGDWKNSPIGHDEHIQNNGALGCTTCHTEPAGCMPCHGTESTYSPPPPTEHFCGTCHLTDQVPHKGDYS